MTKVEIFSNQRCMVIDVLPEREHSANFYRAVSEMEQRTGNSVTFINEAIAIIPCQGDDRFVVTV